MKYTKAISLMILIGALPVHASELIGIKQNILENNALDEEGTIWNDLPLLPMELIVSFILYEHPLIPFILERVKLDHSTLQGHTGSIRSAVFNTAGDKVVTASWDQTARFWETTAGKRIRLATILRGHVKVLNSAVFNQMGDKLVTASHDNTAKIWDSTTGKCLATLEGHEGTVLSAVFRSAGDQVVTVSRDASVKTWDVGTGECMTTIILQGILDKTSHLPKSRHPTSRLDKRPYSATFSRIGDKVLTIAKAQFAKMWDTTTGMCISRFGDTRGCFDSSAAFNASGDKVVTGSHDKTAKIWDTTTGKRLTTLEGHTNTVSTVAFSRAGDNVVTGSEDKTAKIWDTQTGQCLVTLTGHTGSVNSVAFNELGDRMITASSDTTAKIWNISIWPKLQKYFSRCAGITLNQAVILDSIYEVIKENLEEKAVSAGQKFFDFTTYEHLQDDYEDLPQELQTILDPYVKKATLESNTATSSTARSKSIRKNK